MSVKSKVLVVGLDGASFNILDPLVQAGKMPHLGKLMQRGKSYYLKSTIPSNTPVAWTSMITGNNPGKHGVFGFFKYDHPEQKVVSAQDNKSKCLWTYLGTSEKSSIVVNIPFTWPPQRIQGALACFDWTPKGAILAEPPSVNEHIQKHSLDKIATFHPDMAQPNLERYLDIVRKETDFALHLSKQYQWELLFIVFMVTDSVVHLYPTRQDLLREVYGIVDCAIGRLLTLIDLNKDQILITSDHGTRIYTKEYPIPAFFRRQRLLSLRLSLKQSALLFLTSFIDKILQPYHANLTFPKFFKKRVQQPIRVSLKDLIDTKKSPLVVCDENSKIDVLIKINSNLVTNTHIKQKLRLKIISNINSREEVVKGIWFAEELYSGPHVSNAPDLIIEMADGLAANLEPSSFFQNTETYSSINGGHIRNGILIAAGKDISPHADRTQISVCDIAPTILHTLQTPIPINMDGKMIEQLYDNNSALAIHPTYSDVTTQHAVSEENVYTSAAEEDMRERLIRLGYL